MLGLAALAAAPPARSAPPVRLAVGRAEQRGLRGRVGTGRGRHLGRTRAGATDIYAAISHDDGVSFGPADARERCPGRRSRVGRAGARASSSGTAVEVAWISRAGTRPAFARRERGRGPSRSRPPPPCTPTTCPARAAGPPLATRAREAHAHVVWLDGRTRRTAPAASHADAAGHLPRDPASGRQPRRGHRRDRRLLLLQDGGRHRLRRGRLRRLAAHLSHQPARHRRRALDRRRPDVLARRSGSARTDGRSRAVPTTVRRWPSTTRASCTSSWPTMVAQPRAVKGIFYSYSTDGGRTFAPRQRVDAEGLGAAHPQIAAGRRPGRDRLGRGRYVETDLPPRGVVGSEGSACWDPRLRTRDRAQRRPGDLPGDRVDALRAGGGVDRDHLHCIRDPRPALPPGLTAAPPLRAWNTATVRVPWRA